MINTFVNRGVYVYYIHYYIFILCAVNNILIIVHIIINLIYITIY